VRHGPNLRAVLAAAKTGVLTTSEKSLDSLPSSNATSSIDAHGSANTTTATSVAATSGSSAPDLLPPTTVSSSSSLFDLQAHPGVLAVLREACAAPGMALDPSLPGDRIVARDVGAFVSRPGAADQP